MAAYDELTLDRAEENCNLRPSSDEKSPMPKNASVRAWYALIIFIAVALMALVDRQILVLIAEPLRKSLDLSDMRLGLLQGVGLALFVGIASYPVGWLADRYDRRLVLAGCILVWSAATIACGFARDFPEMMLATAILGIGEAGLFPTVYGLIPHFFFNRMRPLANAIFSASTNLAGAGAFIIGGGLIHSIGLHQASLPTMFQDFEPWRLTFLAAAVPGPLLILLVVTLRMHRGGLSVDAVECSAEPTQIKPFLAANWQLLTFFFIGCGLVNMGFAAVLNWVPIVAVRVYGAASEQVGMGMGMALIAGLLAGFAGGTLYTRSIMPRLGKLASYRVIWLGSSLAVLPAAAMPWADSLSILYTLTGAQIAFVMAGIMAFPTVVQDFAPDELRSRVMAIGMIATVGMQALGPILAGGISDQLSDHANGSLLAVAIVAASGLAAGALLQRRAETTFIRSTGKIS